MSRSRLTSSKVNPLRRFLALYRSAQKAGQKEADAMVLSTVNGNGRPSSRVVLYRGICEGGLSFFTNYESRKARELEENPYVSVVFFWRAIDVQVRVEGVVKKASVKESDRYWNQRPRGSQISGTVSPQSQEIPSLQILNSERKKFEKSREGMTIPRPVFWGGFVLEPLTIEFWKEGKDRFHRRTEFRRNSIRQSRWQVRLLAP